MFENNNNENNTIKIESFEVSSAPEIPALTEGVTKKNKKRGGGRKFMKVFAGIIAVIVLGGASGISGAYLYDYLNEDGANIITANAPGESEKGGSSKDNSGRSDSVILMDTSAKTTGDVSQMLENVSASVAFITAKFENSGTSGGTGIIMSSDGYLVTNAHVIQTQTNVVDNSGSADGYGYPFDIFGFGGFGGYGSSYKTVIVDADEIVVTLNDGKEYAAKVVGADTTTDLAVLKIDADDLKPAVIGDSSALVIGEACYTLGFPLGIGLTASDGIVSGLNRDIGIEMSNGKSQDIALIQTTAAINPGNSGGPLLDSHGAVIGITSAKLVSSEVEGFGFAIPITTAMPIISELMTTGSYTSTAPVIGISGSDVNTTTARYYGLPVTAGVLVAAVTEGSGAQAAGIEAGDIIVKADGEDVATMDDLNAIKNTHKAGDTMILTLARADGNVDVSVTLGN
jgi:serine protease Do